MKVYISRASGDWPARKAKNPLAGTGMEYRVDLNEDGWKMDQEFNQIDLIALMNILGKDLILSKNGQSIQIIIYDEHVE